MNEREWYYYRDGERIGPISESKMVSHFANAELGPDTMVWTSELPEWTAANTIDGLVPPSRRDVGIDYQHSPLTNFYPIYAGFWKRFAAAFIDGIVLMIAGLVIGGALGYAYGAMAGTAEGSEFIGNIVGILLGWLYSALLESSSRQATLGKMALGIKVTDLGGNPISFDKASGRYFGKIISTLIVFIGYIMVAFTERKQGLHDIMAGCLVVNK